VASKVRDKAANDRSERLTPLDFKPDLTLRIAPLQTSGFEPRYDRCGCEGAWLRIRHAVVRNFITYGGGEDKRIRPQIMSYAAAFGAGVTVASWEPDNPSVLPKGYQSVVTQAWVGVVVNALAEFAPDVKRMLRKNKADDK
jgi:hypothetical protein